MDWKQRLVYISGTVEEELLLRNEYLGNRSRGMWDQKELATSIFSAEAPAVLSAILQRISLISEHSFLFEILISGVFFEYLNLAQRPTADFVPLFRCTASSMKKQRYSLAGRAGEYR